MRLTTSSQRLYACMCVYVLVPYESLLSSPVCKHTASANTSPIPATPLFASNHINNGTWQWKLVEGGKKIIKSWITFKEFEDSKDPQLHYKKFIPPMNCTCSQRRLNNKYSLLHHLGHRSWLNQVFTAIFSPLSPIPPSVPCRVRAPGSAVDHLKSSWDFLINATGFKWSLSTPGVEKRWRVQPVSPEAAHFACQYNS